MGLYIQNNEVLIDHSHNQWLLTTPAGNPTSTILDGLEIHCVFKRLRASGKMRRQKHVPGDSCPIIYAMKRKQNLIVSEETILELWKNADLIAPEIIKAIEPVDVFASMPSSHQISHQLGQLLSKISGKAHVTDVFEKVSIKTANEQLDVIRADLSKDDFQKLRFRLKKMEQDAGTNLIDFSLKDIPTEFRKYFAPIILSPAYVGFSSETNHVCLVDDLLASGTTLAKARELLLSYNAALRISAACLFSPL